jgi:hypothetical protein
VSEDPHSPTTAGPEPAEAAAQAPDAPARPMPGAGPAQAPYGQPAGSALLGGPEAVDPHPERVVGAAFAGGVVAALFLKGLARRRHS